MADPIHLPVVRKALEERLGRKLPTEEHVKAAFEEVTRIRGARLDAEFDVAVGRVRNGMSFVGDGGEEMPVTDDELKWWLSR